MKKKYLIYTIMKTLINIFVNPQQPDQDPDKGVANYML